MAEPDAYDGVAFFHSVVMQTALCSDVKVGGSERVVCGDAHDGIPVSFGPVPDEEL